MSGKIFTGTVISKKMQKTAVVEVQFAKVNARYGKRYFEYKKFKVHDEEDKLNLKDKVIIQESKPISKTKTWIVKEVVIK